MAIPRVKKYHDGHAFIHLFGPIGAKGITTDDWYAALNKCRDCKRLVVLIDSHGGQTRTSWEMAKSLREFPAETEAIAVGVCASAAVDALQACGYRYALVGSTLMLHEAKAANQELVDAETLAMLDFYSPRTRPRNHMLWGIDNCASPEQIESWIQHETWFSAAEAKFYNLVMDVLEPSAQIPLRTEVDLAGRNRPDNHPPYVVQRSGQIVPLPEVSADALPEATLPDAFTTDVSVPEWKFEFELMERIRELRQQKLHRFDPTPILPPPIPARLYEHMVAGQSQAADLRKRLQAATAVSRSTGKPDARELMRIERLKALVGFK